MSVLQNLKAIGKNLITAAAQNDLSTVQTLLSGGIKSGTSSSAGLFRKSVDVNKKDTEGCTALHHAALNGHMDICELLLTASADIDALDNNGMTPLHMASFGDKHEVAKLLLDHSANVDITSSRAGETPLHICAAVGHVKTLQLLVDYGGNPQATTDNGETILDLAAAGGYQPVVDYIISLQQDLGYTIFGTKAQPSEATSDHLGALHRAAGNGHLGVIESLLAAGMDIDSPSVSGTPISIAATKRKADAVRLLLRKGADSNLAEGSPDAERLAELMQDLDNASPLELFNLLDKDRRPSELGAILKLSTSTQSVDETETSPKSSPKMRLKRLKDKIRSPLTRTKSDENTLEEESPAALSASMTIAPEGDAQHPGAADKADNDDPSDKPDVDGGPQMPPPIPAPYVASAAAPAADRGAKPAADGQDPALLVAGSNEARSNGQGDGLTQESKSVADNGDVEEEGVAGLAQDLAVTAQTAAAAADADISQEQDADGSGTEQEGQSAEPQMAEGASNTTTHADKDADPGDSTSDADKSGITEPTDASTSAAEDKTAAATDHLAISAVIHVPSPPPPDDDGDTLNNTSSEPADNAHGTDTKANTGIADNADNADNNDNEDGSAAAAEANAAASADNPALPAAVPTLADVPALSIRDQAGGDALSQAAGAILREGPLWKKPQRRAGKVNFNSMSRQRWFVLRPTALDYYVYSADEQKIGKAKGHIELADVVTVQPNLELSTDTQHCFEVIQQDAELQCVAATLDERNAWIEAIRQAKATHGSKQARKAADNQAVHAKRSDSIMSRMSFSRRKKRNTDTVSMTDVRDLMGEDSAKPDAQEK